VTDEDAGAGRGPEGGADQSERGPDTTPPAAYPRLAAIVEVVACSGFPSQLAIAGVLSLAGVRPFDARGRLSVAYVFTLSIADAMLLVALVAWFLRLHGESVRAVLLGSRPLLRESLLGLLQLPAVFLLVIAVMTAATRLAPWLHNVPRNPMEGLIGTRLDAWLFAAVALVGGGIREEVQRAFILHRFEQHLGGASVGLILFSIVFASGHVIQGRDVALTTGVLGLFWGVVYLARRSIASAVVSHSCFNSVEILRFALRV
jgi:membrane protease YdiL (CAAX protease family)